MSRDGSSHIRGTKIDLLDVIVMSEIRDNLADLLSLRAVLNEAIKSQRRSDKCHDNFIKRTNTVGFSRASTTTYTAMQPGMQKH